MDLDVVLVPVHVTLRPTEADGRIVASLLEVTVEHGRAVEPGGESPADDSWPRSAVVVSAARGPREIELLLPAVPTTLRVHPNANGSPTRADLAWMRWPKPPAARRFTPEPGKVNQLEIEVPPPR